MQAKNEEAVTHLLNDVVEFARGRLPEPTAAGHVFLRIPVTA